MVIGQDIKRQRMPTIQEWLELVAEAPLYQVITVVWQLNQLQIYLLPVNQFILVDTNLRIQ